MTAFAAIDTTVTVKFYNDTVDPDVQLWTTRTVEYDSAVPVSKPYLPGGYTDPLGGAASVYDAIFAAAEQIRALPDEDPEIEDPPVVGWDANPAYGDPGGYIEAIGDFVTWNDYDYDPITGHHISEGEGWVCTVIPDGDDPYDPIQYLTAEALEDGMEIIFRFQSYRYEWDD
ncbi:hypothetical protein [Oxobacter pfennigii]|nr:hypothetical protein [Oxobacter pfennigii]